MEGQLLPAQRTCEVWNDLLGVKVSEGTLYNTKAQCFKHLALIEQEL
jgi:transposase